MIQIWTLQTDTRKRGALVSTRTKLGPIKTDTERQGAHRIGTSADTSDKVHYWHRQRESGPPNKRGAVVCTYLSGPPGRHLQKRGALVSTQYRIGARPDRHRKNVVQ